VGTVAVSSITQGVQNNKRVVEAVVTGSGSYATGGDTIPVTTLGLRQIDAIELPSHRSNGASAPAVGAAIEDTEAQTGKTVQLGGTVLIPKLKYYDTADTEETAEADLSTIIHVVRFIGT